MKRITAIALFFTAIFIALGGSLVQAQTVEAKIPFAFIVGKQVLPAGTYQVHSIGTNLVEIGTRERPAMEKTTTYADSNGLAGVDKLVFNKYGDQYFLREVLCDSATIHLELPSSKLEKQLRIREARLRSAEQLVAAVR